MQGLSNTFNAIEKCCQNKFTLDRMERPFSKWKAEKHSTVSKAIANTNMQKILIRIREVQTGPSLNRC